jgi:ribonuclease HIII
MFNLTPQSQSSYRCSEPAQIAAWLVEQGYHTEDPRNQYEYLRLRKARSLIVIYHTGTVLLQGADTETPHTLFQTLESPALELPF